MNHETDRKINPASIAATADHFLDIPSGGVVPTLNPSTTFARDDSYRPLNPAHVYARDDSPAFTVAERVLAELENGTDCRLFASGMAAVATVFYTLSPGAHVVVPDSMYWGVLLWIKRFCERNDIVLSYYDPADAESIKPALDAQSRTDIVWVETPSNPFLHVTDIARAATLTHAAGAMLVVDSTAATPVFTRPLDLGADLVLHSATKYLNGHSDVLAGALVTRETHALWDAVCQERHDAGAVCGAFESWLLVRGMRTLYVRVERAAENALQVARFLSTHNAVEHVLYPGLPDHRGHTIAQAQMSGGFGGLLSFQVNGNAETALKVAGALRLIPSATSLGGVETLIEHRHSVEPPETGIPENLLRLSVGIEHAEDLIADLQQALG